MNRLMICAWIETSSAAIASSQTRNSGLHGERAGDADAAALAAGELMRIAPHQRRDRGRRGPATRRHSARRVARVRRARARRGASPTMSSTRIARVERSVGSWKIICILSWRAARGVGAASPRESTALEQHARPRSSGSRPASMRPSVDLPQPDSPTRPTTSPLAIARSTPSTACTISSRRPAPRRCAMRAGKVERLDEALRNAARLDDRHSQPWRGCRRCAHAGIPWCNGWHAAHLARPDRAQRIVGVGGAGRRRHERSARGRRSRAAGSAATASCPGSGPAARRAGCGSAPSRAVPAYRGAPAGRRHRRVLPVSTMRPAYMTAIRSARPATTARSCVIQISAVPVLRAQLLHLDRIWRLDGDVERGGRLVGDDQVGR